MPKKLQLKLMSNSGELLNVVSCFAGQVAVFRATAQSDLRPYQRALCGSQGKERFSVVVDGTDYRPEGHILIGFGEPAPHDGLTARDYLLDQGVPDGSVEGLLLSYGLESSADSMCSSLSPDEERRLRIVAATCQPQKIIILNEPFEPVATQWRERMAELLVQHARSRQAIVVVTSLSYRPECWIDNDAVARVQVGDTIQRTVGFGTAGSVTNNLMNQLKEMMRSEHLSSEGTGSPSTGAGGHTLAAGGAILVGSAALESSQELLIDPTSISHTGGLHTLSSKAFGKLGLAKVSATTTIIGGSVVAVGLSAVAAFSLMSKGQEPPPVQVATNQPSVQQPLVAPPALSPEHQQPPTQVNSVPGLDELIEGPAKVTAPPPVDAPPSTQYVLDGYPDLVRTSLSDTARGLLGDSAPTAGSSPAEPQANPTGGARSNNQGNLFKLLESASTNGTERAGPAGENSDSSQPPAAYNSWPPPPASEAPMIEQDSSDEQARREAIRQKFLEAIRAAAERRQAAMDGAGQ